MQKKMRFLSLLLAIVLSLSIFPLPAAAASPTAGEALLTYHAAPDADHPT